MHEKVKFSSNARLSFNEQVNKAVSCRYLKKGNDSVLVSILEAAS